MVSLVCAVEGDTPPGLRFGRSVRVVLVLPVREHVVRGWSRCFRFLVVSVIFLFLSSFHRVIVLNVYGCRVQVSGGFRFMLLVCALCGEYQCVPVCRFSCSLTGIDALMTSSRGGGGGRGSIRAVKMTVNRSHSPLLCVCVCCVCCV